MKNIKKLIWILPVILLISLFISAAYAQDTEENEESILKQFPKPLYTYRFFQNTKREYYRFPYHSPCFDPLDLKYFPHEAWNETDWGLLARYEDSFTYKQQIMLSDPAETWIFHGTSIGPDFGFLDDFYLYATLFVSDSSPDNAGSCYVYYSDSLLKGLNSNTGVLVDPERGIFRVNNYYDVPYDINNKSHELNIIQTLDRQDFPINENDIPASAYYADDFIYDLMDYQFERDWNSVKSEYHIPGSTVRAYRIEMVREGTILRVYINGKLAGTIDDEIFDYDKDRNTIPGKVSWSYGPLLREGGETVTCSIGALYINGRMQTGGDDDK
ncbi:MAG: hypothetical protein IKP86_09680 [Anaerolineaceae bacterium]|nr:hypothetical protein [Anaerolineaceae bacterium]